MSEHTECWGYAKIAFQIMVTKDKQERFYFDRNNEDVQKELARLLGELIARGDWIELQVEDAICTGP